MVPPASLRVPRVRRYSGYCRRFSYFVYVTFTLFGLPSQAILLYYILPFSVLYPGCIATPGLPSFHFARRYFGNLFWFLFLALLRCFSSGGSLRITIYSLYDDCVLPQPGCPIQISAGQWLFAPLRSFSQLITSFVGSWCQGILHMLFLTWPLFSLLWASYFSELYE